MEKEIVRFQIHPAIGIARVGNSADTYYFGPEVPRTTSMPDDGKFKDEKGRIKRQAARFRIYGLDQDGNVVKEISTSDPEIEDINWNVHLANKKAAWYDFELALDIPVSQNIKAGRRNDNIEGKERDKLVIDPGPRSVHGANGKAVFDGGRFLDVDDIYLGEIHTDHNGRLTVLGGRGHSGTSKQHPQPLTTFANNEGWYDDTSDGPVQAEIVMNGKTYVADPAWVVVAPPDYTPGINGIVTMYDVMLETATLTYPALAPHQVSFTQHILPILDRFSKLQWVNKGFFSRFGLRSNYDFADPTFLTHLADPADQYRALRLEIFQKFRQPDTDQMDREGWPPVYGDGMDLPPNNPQHWLTVTTLQYDWLRKWANGDFVSDYNPHAQVPQSIEELDVSEQPHALDQAALEACLGGAFHPGCEMTWPMRVPSMYRAPFRLNMRAEEPEPNYGEVLTPDIALSPNGPLSSSGPGDITRWMAVPWQTDTDSCRSGYEWNRSLTHDQYPGTVNPYLPTFWPARVPNQVLSEEWFDKFAEEYKAKGLTEKSKKYFGEREEWLRTFGDTLEHFAQDWYKAGIVVPVPAPEYRSNPDDPKSVQTLTPVMHVESEVGDPDS